MGYPSLKKELILAHLDLDLNNEFYIIVITPIGIITGRPILDPVPEENIKYTNFLRETIDKYHSDYNIADTQLLDGDDGFFALKDVTIKTSISTTVIPQMSIFYDQVIGITTGRLDSGE